MESNLILVTGGARSGKSSWAEKLANNLGEKVVYIATCLPRDEEMTRRVALHQERRPRQWTTVEEEYDLDSALKAVPAETQAVIIDCLTLWLTNLLLRDYDDNADADRYTKQILCEVSKMGKTAADHFCLVIVVTNEVGSGIVPENRLGRVYRDLAGQANQTLAGWARDVWLVSSGIPINLKKLAKERGWNHA